VIFLILPANMAVEGIFHDCRTSKSKILFLASGAFLAAAVWGGQRGIKWGPDVSFPSVRHCMINEVTFVAILALACSRL